MLGLDSEHSTIREDHPFVMIGDFNTDHSYAVSKCGDRIGEARHRGRYHASPTKGEVTGP